jgi:hypothetical protein
MTRGNEVDRLEQEDITLSRVPEHTSTLQCSQAKQQFQVHLLNNDNMRVRKHLSRYLHFLYWYIHFAGLSKTGPKKMGGEAPRK